MNVPNSQVQTVKRKLIPSPNTMVQKELYKYVSVKARDRGCQTGQRNCSEGRSNRMTEVIEVACFSEERIVESAVILI